MMTKAECLSDFGEFANKSYPCLVSVAMNLIGGKYKAVILYHLQDGKKRFGELHAQVHGVTEAILSRELKQLEKSGLITRRSFGTKPPLKVEYALTDFGKGCLPVIEVITAWGNQIMAKARVC